MHYTLAPPMAQVFGSVRSEPVVLPRFVRGASAGFPSLADAYIGQQLDLDLIRK